MTQTGPVEDEDPRPVRLRRVVSVESHIETRKAFGRYLDIVLALRRLDYERTRSRVDELLDLIAECRGRNPEAVQATGGAEAS